MAAKQKSPAVVRWLLRGILPTLFGVVLVGASSGAPWAWGVVAAGVIVAAGAFGTIAIRGAR